MICQCNTVFNDSLWLHCPTCGIPVPEGQTQTFISLTPADAMILLRIASFLARGQSVNPKPDEVAVMRKLADRLEAS